MTRHVIGKVSEIPPGEKKVVDIDGRSIGVYNVNGDFCAILNRCPHQGGPLCLGRTAGFLRTDRPGGVYEYTRKGEIVRCPWHGWEFDVQTGQSWVSPDNVRVRSYEAGVTAPDAVDAEVDPETGYVKGPFTAETYPVYVKQLDVVVELP
ncbi:TPA: 2Fe-2S ferredoxin [Candidatus Latescibacteria bacterium]|nr:2Fe-2S ferredoxin [Candidatus Latescibacterota bacterium]|tara:strand:+ start:1458 stop:1907 length:450 start_codon:yes stop_codon:yes gene_type:complete